MGLNLNHTHPCRTPQNREVQARFVRSAVEMILPRSSFAVLAAALLAASTGAFVVKGKLWNVYQKGCAGAGLSRYALGPSTALGFLRVAHPIHRGYVTLTHR